MMSLASLFDDFPVIAVDNGSPRRRRAYARPLLCSLLDSLEDQMDQKVGHVFRRLPSVMLQLEDELEGPQRTSQSRKRKRGLLMNELAEYEPKSKVVVSSKDNKFCVSLDTSSYQPDEIAVKVVDGKLAISAKHEAKGKDVYEYSEMYRSFDLPPNVDPNALTSRLSAGGQLMVEAPLKELKDSAERNIPVSIEGKKAPAAVENTKSPAKEK